MAFGASGLVLLALVAFLVVGALGALGGAAASLEDQRVRLVALIEPTAHALDRSATTAENAGASLEASAGAARDAAAMTAELAAAMDSMATAAQLEVFGLRPFAALADDLSNVATRSRTLATDLETTATALELNVVDSEAMAADLRTLVGELEAMRVQLGVTETGGECGRATRGHDRPGEDRPPRAPRLAGRSGTPRDLDRVALAPTASV